MSQFSEDLEARFDFFTAQRLQAFRSETLHCERSHYPAVEQRPLQHFVCDERPAERPA